MARHGWAPPGDRASVLGWNFSPRKGWSKPGEAPDINDLQFDMPIGQSPVGVGQGSGYSLLASPPGMQAPRDMFNYTPGTREVAAPGVDAPLDQLNLTAVPTQQGVPMPFDRSQLSPEDAVAELLAAYGIGGSVGTGEDDDKAGKLTQPTASPIKGPVDLAGDALGWIGDVLGRPFPQRGVGVVPTGDEVAPLGGNIPMSDAEADRLAELRNAARKPAAGLPGEGEKTIVKQAEGFDARGNKVLYNIWSDGTASQVLGMVEPPQKRNTSIISLGGNQVMVDDETGEVVKNLGPSGTGPQGPQPQVVTGDDGKKYIVHPGTGAVTPLEGISTKPDFVTKGNKEYKRDAEGKLVPINEFEKEPTPFEFKTVGKKTYVVDPMNPFNPDFNKVIFEDTSPEFKTVGDKRIVKIDPKTGVPETVWTAPDEVRAIGSDIWIPKGSNAKINYKDVPAITPQNWSAPAMNWEKPKMGADDLYKWISGKGQDVGVGADPSDEISDVMSLLLDALRNRATAKRVAEDRRWGRPLTEGTRAKFPEISKMLRGENPAQVEPRVPKMELGRMIGSPERLDPLAEGAGKGVSPGIERLATAEREARLTPEAKATLNAWRQAQEARGLAETPLTIRSQARGAPSAVGTAAQDAVASLRQQFPAPGPVQQAVGKAAQWARPVVDVVGKAAKWADPVLTPLTIIEGLTNQLRANDELSRGWSSAADVARESNPGWNLYPEEMRRGMETRPGEVPAQDKTISKRQPDESFIDYMARFFGTFGRGQDVGQGADLPIDDIDSPMNSRPIDVSRSARIDPFSGGSSSTRQSNDLWRMIRDVVGAQGPDPGPRKFNNLVNKDIIQRIERDPHLLGKLSRLVSRSLNSIDPSNWMPQGIFPDPNNGWMLPSEKYRQASARRVVGQGADQGDLSRLHDTGWTPPVPAPQIEGMGNKFGQPVDMEGVHKGTDLQAVQGTPAVAPVSGTVINVIFDPKGLGLQVVIQDEQGNKHKLSHLSDAMVKPGDQIQMGQPVGKVGSTGAGSTGPHLDYREQTPDGQYLNPEDRMGSLAQMPMSPNTVGAGQAEPPGPPGWWPEGVRPEGWGAGGNTPPGPYDPGNVHAQYNEMPRRGMPPGDVPAPKGWQPPGVGQRPMELYFRDPGWKPTTDLIKEFYESTLGTLGNPRKETKIKLSRSPNPNLNSRPYLVLDDWVHSNTGPAGKMPGGGVTSPSAIEAGIEGSQLDDPLHMSGLRKLRWGPEQIKSMIPKIPNWEKFLDTSRSLNPNAIDLSQLLPRWMFEEAINPGSIERQKIGAGQDVGVGAEGDGDGSLNVNATDEYQARMAYQGILAQIESQRRQMDQQYEIAKKQLENDRYKFDSEMEFKKAQQRLDEEYRRKALDLDWNKFQVDWSYRQEEARQGRAFQTAQSALSNPWLQNLTGMKPGWGEPGAPGSEGWAAPQPFQEQNRTQMPDWQSLWGTPGQGPNADLPPMAGQELGGQQQLGSQVGDAMPQQPGGSGPVDTRWRPPQGPREIPQPVIMPPSGPPSNRPNPVVPPGGFGGPVSPGGQQPSQGGGGQQPPTPTMGFDDWNKLSPFQQAGLRTKEMMRGPGAWESFSEQLRNRWGQGGVKQTPDVTQLSAAAANPAQRAAWGNTADVFGERPDQFWNRQNKGWSRAGRSDVTFAG